MTVVTLGKDTSGRPLKMDSRMLAKQHLAEGRLGVKLTIVQGSYMAGHGASQSEGYHDKGGTADYRVWDLPPRLTPQMVVTELRKAGIIAWYRTEAQGFDPHIHAVDYGNPNLAPGAASQVRDWEAGRNGLASGGRDDGARVHIPKDPPDPFAIPEKEPGMNHVQYGTKLIRAGLAEWAKAKGRPLVKTAAVVVRRGLNLAPKK